MKNLFIVLTIIAMIFGAASPGFANADQSTDSLKGMQDLSKNQQASVSKHLQELRAENAVNNKELSKENKQIANKALKNYKNQLTYATILDGEEVVFLSTDQENIQVTITGNTVEILEQIDADTYEINGERSDFEITVTDEDGAELSTAELSGDFGTMASGDIGTMAFDGWYSSGYKSGPWTVEMSGRWINVNAQRNFATYTAGALGSIIGGVIGAVFGWPAAGAMAGGVALGAAYTFVAASEYPTNVGRSLITTYRNGPYPTSDKRIRSSNHAVVGGVAHHVGTDYTYYVRCIACGAGR